MATQRDILPKVGPLGTRKTIWFNFQEICQECSKSTEEMMKLVGTTLGVVCHHHEEKLIIKGRLTSEQIFSVYKDLIPSFTRPMPYMTVSSFDDPEDIALLREIVNEDLFSALAVKINDREGQELFKRIGKKTLSSWNRHTFDMMKIFSTCSYASLKVNPQVWASFASTKLGWLFHLENSSFKAQCRQLSESNFENLESDDKEIVRFIMNYFPL